MDKEIFPTEPNQEGFFYQNEDEKTAETETKIYENGATVKRVKLSSGSFAVIRMLKGRDFMETKKRLQSDNSLDPETIGVALATKVDGKQHPPEFYLDDLYQNDYLKIFLAYGLLNLQ